MSKRFSFFMVAGFLCAALLLSGCPSGSDNDWPSPPVKKSPQELAKELAEHLKAQLPEGMEVEVYDTVVIIEGSGELSLMRNVTVSEGVGLGVAAGAVVTVVNGRTLTLEKGALGVGVSGTLIVAARGTLTAGAEVFVDWGGTLTVADGGKLMAGAGVFVDDEGTLEVASDAGLVIQSGGYLLVKYENTVTWGSDDPVDLGCYIAKGQNFADEMVKQFDDPDSVEVTGSTISLISDSEIDLPSPFVIPYAIRLEVPFSGDWGNLRTLNVKSGGTLTVKDRGTLEVHDGTLNVAADAVINVKDSGTLEVQGSAGRINVNGSITVEDSGTLKVWDNEAELTVKEDAVITVKDSGTLEVSVGTITVKEDAVITMQDGGKITFLGSFGTLNVEGTITLGSTAEIKWEDHTYLPESPARIVIGSEGNAKITGARNFYNGTTPITGDITTGTYVWDDDAKKWQKQQG